MSRRPTRELVELPVVAAVVLTIPLWLTNGYYLDLAVTILMYAVAGLGARLLMLGGLWSFGQGTFLTIGAYCVGLGTTRWGLNFWETLFIGGFVAGAFALLIGYPVLRVRGVQFSILTMVMLFAIQEFIVATPGFTNGPGGIVGIAAPNPIHLGSLRLTFETETGSFYIIAVVFLCAFVAMKRIDRSRLGLLLDAMREESTLAESVGIRVARYRVLIFGIACFFSGLVGAFSAPYYSTAHPDVWALWPSIFILAYAVIGGVGSVYGPLIGSAAVILAAEELRATQGLQVILLGVGLMLVMYLLPGGLASLPASRHRMLGWGDSVYHRARRRMMKRDPDAPSSHDGVPEQ